MVQTSGDGGSPSGIALIAGAGVPSHAGSPQQGMHPGAALRRPPLQHVSLQVTPQVVVLPQGHICSEYIMVVNDITCK